MTKSSSATSKATCTIEWNSLSLADWQERFKNTRRASLLQSYDYARSICSIEHQKARWGLIKINGQEAGLVQILEASLLKNAIHNIQMDCGPVWFEGFNTAESNTIFYEAFNKEFPRRFGRRRRIIPDATSTELVVLIQNKNYKKTDHPGYQTIWLDITGNLETIRSDLDQKWRHSLNKSEKKDLSIEWDREGKHLLSFLKHYKDDKAEKNYDGASLKTLHALGKIFGASGNLLIGRALLDNKVIAAIFILCHGSSATYQAGWSSPQGRDTSAHNLLLWQAIQTLKEKEIHDLDLGGVNDETAKGVKKFKEGMGGETVISAGHYT